MKKARYKIGSKIEKEVKARFTNPRQIGLFFSVVGKSYMIYKIGYQNH